MILFQVPLPTNDTNPYIWIAGVLVVALGALFVRYDNGNAKRTERCESREDRILEDNRAQAATIKEQSTTLVRVAALAEDSFAMAKATSETTTAIRDLLERTPGNARQRS